ncbi:hypothetical protein AGMMS50276_26320 [Synergistales bacterium]|nr:hypothetical protein AGMMS50276_26320 [Synergistales bacterium]
MVMANRVSTMGMFYALRGSMQSNLQNLLNLQTQMLTQRKYSKLSDNPAEIARALSIESSMASTANYISSQNSALETMSYTEGALASAVDILQKIRVKVINAGDGALDATAAGAIADEIDALKANLMEVLNSKMGNKYIFGGADTDTRPFVMGADGQIKYVGSDERIRYEMESGVLSDVTFTGLDIMPNDNKSYFICSHYVPLDWGWEGREEKVQITVGNRTLSVFIPEQWIDEVATGGNKATDYNRFRDPDELSKISLDDLATLVNRALVEQGADMLVTATVEKDYAAGQQRLMFKSNTGEMIGVTGWPTTDYQPMAQSIAGLELVKDPAATGYWNFNVLTGDKNVDLGALTIGTSYTLSISVAGKPSVPVSFTPAIVSPSTTYDMDSLLDNLNNALTGTGLTAEARDNKLALVSSAGDSIQIDTASTALKPLFGSITQSQATDQGGLRQHGLMGSVTTLGWRGDGLGKQIDVTVGTSSATFNLDNYKNISELAQDINAKLKPGVVPPFASIISGRLALQSKDGEIKVTDTGTGTPGGTAQLFGTDYASGITSSTSSLEIKVADSAPVKIYINDKDTLQMIAERIDAIEGLYARTSVNKDQLVIAAIRIGDAAPDPLAPVAATEKLHYPSFMVTANGMANSLFNFGSLVDSATGIETGELRSKEETRAVDHSHMDVFDYLGMETCLKSREFKMDEKFIIGEETAPGSGVYTGEPLRWRIISGSRETEITINAGAYDMAQLGEKLKNAGAGWLDISIDVQPAGSDAREDGLGTSENFEDATVRLVVRGLQGQPVVFLDMNSQRYAEKAGLSTALRTDVDANGNPVTGVKYIKYPDAPCLDDNLPAMIRLQKSCGQYFDIRLKRGDVEVFNPDYPGAGPEKVVDRVKVMNQIAKQVNEQAGFEMMKVFIPVDANGKQLENAASLVALTGEPFEVVDLPVMDPNWKDHSGGIAAQMGIHGGVTANMDIVEVTTTTTVNGTTTTATGKLTDATKMGDIDGLTTGTIRFESLGRVVEIDVGVNDTVKSIMERLRSQAGDWLYVNYFDPNMGDVGYLAGDSPMISIAAKDCSAVNVIDVKGNVAETLTLNTGIQGKIKLVSDPPATTDWTLSIGTIPAPTFTINVAGYSHRIDLSAMRDKNGNGVMDATDLVETINARMQDYDVRAEINKDGYLVLWSPRGYGIEITTDIAPYVTTITTGNYTEDFETIDGAYHGPVVNNVYTVDMHGSVPPTNPATATDIDDGATYLDFNYGDLYTYDQASGLWTTPPVTLVAGDVYVVSDGSSDEIHYLDTAGDSANSITAGWTDVKATNNDNAILKGNDIMIFENGAWTSFDAGTYTFLGAADAKTPYRGGYELDEANKRADYDGTYFQNVSTRGGANTMKQNFFGVLTDVSAAIRAENRDGLADKLLPMIDKFMDTLLRVRSTNGAQQVRYENNMERLELNQIVMTEAHDELIGVDLTHLTTELAMAQALYQASLGIIAYIVQPTLLDYLR